MTEIRSPGSVQRQMLADSDKGVAARGVSFLTVVGDGDGGRSPLARADRQPELSAGCQRPKSIVGLCRESAVSARPPLNPGTKGR